MDRHSAETVQIEMFIRAGRPKLAFALVCLRSRVTLLAVSGAIAFAGGGSIIANAVKAAVG